MCVDVYMCIGIFVCVCVYLYSIFVYVYSVHIYRDPSRVIKNSIRMDLKGPFSGHFYVGLSLVKRCEVYRPYQTSIPFTLSEEAVLIPFPPPLNGMAHSHMIGQPLAASAS